MGLKSLMGLCALLLSLPVNSGEINIQDAWVRPLTPGQEDAMVGMVINSDTAARITAVMSPAYKLVAMQGPGKSGTNKPQEIGHIALPAKTPVMLGADSMHLLLSGNKNTLAATDKVPLFLTVKFDDDTRKVISIMAQPVLGKGAAAAPVSSSGSAQTSTAVPPPAPVTPVESKVEAKTVTPPPQPAPSKATASPAKPVAVAAPKPPVAEAKPAKAAPVAAPKPAPAPVATSVVAAPIAPPAPVAAPAAVTVVAPLAVEPKKAPEAKPAEQPKQQEAQASAECVSLAVELRDCSKVNEMMQEWCVTSAKSKYSCKLSMEQLKKL